MSKTLHHNLQSKIATLQGPEWDSSDEEQENTSKPGTPVSSSKRKQSIAERKRSKKQANKKQKQETGDDENNNSNKEEEQPTVVYIGHLPNEFEEEDLRTFLSQFGRVENSRISRSIKSGNSRGYAFVKFTDPETAKVVAETMQGYFLGKRRLVCHLVPNPDDGMFYDTDKLIVRRKSLLETEKKRREQNLASADKMKEITSRLMKRERKKRKKLEELGIDYDFPGYQANTNQDEEETQEAKESSSKKKKRKDSIGSVGSAGSRSSRKRKDSISSETSEISKRLDSVGSERNATPVKKRKDSIGSVVSAGSNKSKRKNSEEEEIPKMVPQSEQKKKTKRKSKRRLSRP